MGRLEGIPGLNSDPSSRKNGRRGRWSLRHRVFIGVLVGCLVYAVSFVVHAVRYSVMCVPGSPALVRLPASELTQLRGDLTAAMARADGKVYAFGWVPASVIWTDEPPEGESLHLSADGLGPASYEIRQWAPDPEWGAKARDDIGADVFAFNTPAEATLVFDEATSARCHRSGVERPAPAPPNARSMIWVNPDAATEEDVYLVRGRFVYRIVDVRPAGGVERPTWNPAQRVGVWTVARLACSLPNADCSAASLDDKQART